jgi:hypothetical protein
MRSISKLGLPFKECGAMASEKDRNPFGPLASKIKIATIYEWADGPSKGEYIMEFRNQDEHLPDAVAKIAHLAVKDLRILYDIKPRQWGEGPGEGPLDEPDE